MQQLVNLNNGKILAEHVVEAKGFWKRFRGLMFTKSFPAGSALHIKPCRSIHTFFMSYAIDVLYLDSNFKIVGIDNELLPGKVGKRYAGVSSVVELPAKKILETESKVGQYIKKI